MTNLLRNDMAEKFAKLKMNDVVAKEEKDVHLKSRVTKALELAYLSGYELAMTECRNENSRSGEDMYHYLNELEVGHQPVI